MATTTTAVSLDEALLTRINTRAKELKLSLSRLLAVAAEEYLAKRTAPSVRGEETARLLEEINAAWSDGLDQEEQAVLDGMRRKYREVVKDPW